MPTVLRTPEERFEALPDYPFQPHYIDVEPKLRMHYLDEGDPDHPIILLLHGEPSWSFLYRKMIPVLVQNGFRAIVPDLIGFGKSDKIVEMEAYSYQTHLNWLQTFIQKMGLSDMLLFCQDWGGLLGLRMVADHPEWFTMVVASNTTLPTGVIELPEAFRKWQQFAQATPDFDSGKIVDRATTFPLTPEIIDAYNAPYPSSEYQAGARIFPSLVPTTMEDPEAMNNQQAWQKLQQFDKPFLTIFGSDDPIMLGAEKFFQKIIPGTKGQAHAIIQAGHFIQEDQGEELAKQVTAFYQKNQA